MVRKELNLNISGTYIPIYFPKNHLHLRYTEQPMVMSKGRTMLLLGVVNSSE